VHARDAFNEQVGTMHMTLFSSPYRYIDKEKILAPLESNERCSEIFLILAERDVLLYKCKRFQLEVWNLLILALVWYFEC
jgi:hypothetical protein